MPIQSTDSTSPIVYGADHEVWTIKTGVQVTVSGGGAAITIGHDACTLDNAGGVTADYGVVLGAAGTNAVVINRSGAVINSHYDAINVNGASGFTLQNDGGLHGGQDGLVIQNVDARVTNTGVIGGGFSAVSLLGGGSTLINSGTMTGDYYGLALHASAGNLLTIRNTGTIQGSDNGGVFMDATSQGTLFLDNSGEITGGMQFAGTQGFTRVINTGVIDGSIHFGDGPARYEGRDGAVFGEIRGGSYADVLLAGSGDDTLIGGLGRDTLDGGRAAGEDTFRFDDVKESRFSAPDLITKHFGPEDQIMLNIDANARTHAFEEPVFGGQVAPGATLATGVVDYYQQGGDTFVVLDTSGDGRADFRLQIHGLFSLTADQFIL